MHLTSLWCAPRLRITPTRDGTLEKVVDKMEEDVAAAEAAQPAGAAGNTAEQGDGVIELENAKLIKENKQLQREIDRIKAMEHAPRAALPAPPPQPDAAPPSGSAPPLRVSSEVVELDFEEALDKTVGSLCEELQKKNLELRSNFTTLATENQSLRTERDKMKDRLLRLCYGLEEMVTDIRSAVSSAGGASVAQPPPQSGDTEAENQRLEGANSALFVANRKLRQDNNVLESELSTRQVSRSMSRAATKPLESPP